MVENLGTERLRLLEMMPGLPPQFSVVYLVSHEIEVRFWRGPALRFPVRDWMTDACVARIALEAP